MYLITIRDDGSKEKYSPVLAQYVIKEPSEKYIRTAILDWISNNWKKYNHIKEIASEGYHPTYQTSKYYVITWESEFSRYQESLSLRVEVQSYIDNSKLEQYLTSKNSAIRDFAKECNE